MYCQVWWPILEIGPLHLTHPSAHTQQWVVNTHTVNTHPEQWAAIAPAPGEQLGVRYIHYMDKSIETPPSLEQKNQFLNLIHRGTVILE